jgi:AcrR family transcriptional regulator
MNPPPRGRSEQTRDALLQAALEVFGRDGFHAASTRAISEAAGVNQALIAYHYGGKEGLYLAVFEDITENLAANMGPLLSALQQEVETLDAGKPEDRERCLQCLDRLLAGAIDLFGRPEARLWVKLVMREQQDPTEAFDIFYRAVYGDMLSMFTRLVAELTRQSPEAEATRLLTLTLLGQVLVFMVGRATVGRFVGWTQLGPAERKALHDQVRQTLYARFEERDSQ